MDNSQNNLKILTHVKKRNGQIVPFDAAKITRAITQAGKETQEFKAEIAQTLTIRVLQLASQIGKENVLSVENLQDLVERGGSYDRCTDGGWWNAFARTYQIS